MKFKNKGRKIYKTKEKNYYGKSPAGKVFSALLSAVLIGGIGFIGYSVAEPVVNYTKKQGDDESVIEPTTEFSLENYHSESDGEEYTEPATPAEDMSFTQTQTQPQTSTERPTLEQIEVKEPEVHEYCKAYALSEYDILSLDALNLALSRIPENQEINTVQVPLKTKGGAIYFETYSDEAIISGAVQSRMSPDVIAQTIKLAGYTPCAEISTFRDHIVPMSYHEYSYNTVDDNSLWYDNSPENDGKPWLSPFSEGSINYVSFLVSEAVSAGFEKVVCSDIMFPEFRDSDLEMLDPVLANKDRYKVLTSASNKLYETAISEGASMMLEVSAVDILRNKAEVLDPMLLSVNTVVLDIDLDEIGSEVKNIATVYEFNGTPAENTVKMLGLAKDSLSDFNVVVRISGTLSEEDAEEARQAVLQEGYNSFILG